MLINAFIGDITNTPSYAIVNAAKRSLEGGGGVDGAVHNAAGPELLAHCKSLPTFEDYDDMTVRCATGDAVSTPAFGLTQNQRIIHTVGPVYKQDTLVAPIKLAGCYSNSIQAVIDEGGDSIAFPAISTGIYGYPLEDATVVAVKVARAMASSAPRNFIVNFVCFDEANFMVYDRVMRAANKGWQYSLTL